MNSKFQNIALKSSIAEVMAWLDGVVIGESVDGQHFDWYLFAEDTSRRAKREKSLAWASISLRVFGIILPRTPAEKAESIASSEMLLRVKMIKLFGAREGDYVLDPEVVFTWFKSFVFTSVDEASRLVSSGLRNLPSKTLLALSSLRDAIREISRISDNKMVQRHPELKDWIQFMEFYSRENAHFHGLTVRDPEEEGSS